MKSLVQCPSEAELAAFIRGEVPADRVEILAAHLDACDECRTKWEKDAAQHAFHDDLRWADRAGRAVQVDVSIPLKQLRAALPEYEITREIGRGGMGIVFEARHLTLNRAVALKVLPALLGAVRAGSSQRFKREAELTARLKHTNIISVFDYGEIEGTCFYTMELVVGRSLKDVLDEVESTGTINVVLGLQFAESTNSSARVATPAPASLEADRRRTTVLGTSSRDDRLYFRRVAKWIAEVAEALQYAHDHGVVHRDIKPGNLILAPDGRVLITDFGLARATDCGAMTVSRSVLGTARYMSPEQADSTLGPVDAKSDIYSLGATLYELLTFRPPFGGRDDREVIHRVLNAEPVPPRRIVSQVPWELETVCLKAIEKDRRARYASATEMRDDLERWLLDLPIHAQRPSFPARAFKFIKRRKLTTILVAFLAITLIAGGIGYGEYRAWRSQAVTAMATADDRQTQLLAIEATNLSREGRLQDAMERIEASLALNPNSEYLNLIKGRFLGMMGREKESADTLEMLLRRSPDYWQAHYSLALAFSSHANNKRKGAGPQQWTLQFCNDKAAEHRAEFERLMPPGPRSLVLRAMSELDANEALKLLDQAAELDGSRLEVFAQRSSLHFAAGRFDLALRDADSAIHLLPGWAPIHEIRAKSLEKLGRLSEADEASCSLIKLKPNDENNWERRGRIRVRLRQFEKAVADATEAIRLNPEHASAYVTRGRAHAGLRSPHRALSDFDRAIDLDPDNIYGYAERSVLNAHLGQWERVVSDATRTIELAPNEPRGYKNRAVALHALGRYDREISDITKCIELHPNSQSAFRTRYRAHELLGDHENALQDLTRAMKSKTFPRDYRRRADLRIALGQFEAALPDLCLAIELADARPTTILKRGMAYEATGAVSLARADYERVAKTAGPIADYARLWLHLLDRQSSGANAPLAPAAAEVALGSWTDRLIGLFVGAVSEQALLDEAASDNERCEAHYYIGMKVLLDGRLDAARQAFNACLATNRPDALESHFARIRLHALDRN